MFTQEVKLDLGAERRPLEIEKRRVLRVLLVVEPAGPRLHDALDKLHIVAFAEYEPVALLQGFRLRVLGVDLAPFETQFYDFPVEVVKALLTVFVCCVL